MTVDELIDRLTEVPGYYDVRLNGSIQVTGLELAATEDGPFVVVI